MIFSELYSAYYNAVSHILDAAVKENATEQSVREKVVESAFSESALTIISSLKNEKWQLLKKDFTTPLKHTPTMPLTNLQKQWLKAILSDPRIRLFDVSIPGLDDVEPLFTPDDYKLYDKYSNGDPFESEIYIKKFRLILNAIKTKRSIVIVFTSRNGRQNRLGLIPERLEYSEKDDKFRLIAAGCRFGQFNLAKIESCDYCNVNKKLSPIPRSDEICTVSFELENERNALERAMLHFAHLEKQAERIDKNKYRITLRYYQSDETEILIRILSFGPFIKVTEPEAFVQLIKERLQSQKNCGLL